MVFNRAETEAAVRSALFAGTVLTGAFLLVTTRWYAIVAVLFVLGAIEALLLVRSTTAWARQTARFIDAIRFDDLSQSFGPGSESTVSPDLSAAMMRALDELREGRARIAEQAHYLQNVLTHVPVALVGIDIDGTVELLNRAARLLLNPAPRFESEFSIFGSEFAAAVSRLGQEPSVLVPMKRHGNTLQLKAAISEFSIRQRRHRLISFQNIETELSAQEFASWQAVIGVMTHEIMNSLTPLVSLSSTALALIAKGTLTVERENGGFQAMQDVREALETITKRGEGLLKFVQNHRRMTTPLVVQLEVVQVERILRRVTALLTPEFRVRGICLTLCVDPQLVEIALDPNLIEQMLINLIRNAVDAVRDRPDPRVALLGRREADGRIVLTVEDNGPGVDPVSREKIFVPFFTTKRHGSGIGLTLARQIAVAHGGTLLLTDTPGGGATFSFVL